MALDPSVILAGNPPPDFATGYNNLLAAQMNQMRLQQARSQVQNQNALRTMLQQPAKS